MFESFLLILGAGFLGGAVRGVVGFIKHQQSYKEVPFRPWYLTAMISISGFIGLLAAYVTSELGFDFLGIEVVSPALAIVIGYAGGDMLENLFKILTQKNTVFPVK